MRTARVLTVSPSMLCTGGCTWSRGVSAPGGGCAWSGGMYLVLGGVPGLGVYLVPGGCTWSRGGVPGPGEVYLVPGGAPGPRGCTWSWGGTWSGGCTWSGVYLVPGVGGSVCSRGCTWSQGVGGVRYSPPVNRMTNRCKNITLPQTSFAGGKNYFGACIALNGENPPKLIRIQYVICRVICAVEQSTNCTCSLISLHIRSMWETICDAQAGFWLNSKFWFKILRVPHSQNSRVPPPTPPPTTENWNLGRSWHFEFWLGWEYPPPNWNLGRSWHFEFWLGWEYPPPHQNWNLGRSSDLGTLSFDLAESTPPPERKLSESSSPRVSEYWDLLHVETLSNPDNY